MEREKFKTKAKKSIDDIFAKINELESKRDKVREDAKGEYDERISNLKTRREELQKKYESLKKAGDDKWEEAKKTFSSSADSFKEGFSKLSGLFR
jgi:peptidoglycan hydrolase CwlO-like protein